LAFQSKYGPVLYHFRNKARYWSKIAIFSYPLHFFTSLPRRNTGIRFGTEKLERCGQPTVIKSLRICSFVSTQCTNVADNETDRRTDTQTPHDGIRRDYTWRRAAKINNITRTTCVSVLRCDFVKNNICSLYKKDFQFRVALA